MPCGVFFEKCLAKLGDVMCWHTRAQRMVACLHCIRQHGYCGSCAVACVSGCLPSNCTVAVVSPSPFLPPGIRRDPCSAVKNPYDIHQADGKHNRSIGYGTLYPSNSFAEYYHTVTSRQLQLKPRAEQEANALKKQWSSLILISAHRHM